MSLTDVRRLRTFVLVLDLGSVSAAATVLGYTQSAVSQQLAALEREAGAPLVDRRHRPFRPTAAGAALRPHADRILAALASAEQAVEEARHDVPRRLRLASFPSALAAFVPAAVRDLRRDDADVVVQMLQAETREAVAHVRDGSAHLAVVHHMPGVLETPAPELDRHLLLVDELAVVLPVRHRLAAHDAVRLADLEDEPLLLPRRDTPAGRFRAMVEHLCAEAGFAPRVAYEVDDLPAAQAFAAAGIAVVLMHRLTLARGLPGVAVRALQERRAGSRSVEALLPPQPRPPVADRLLGHLASAARPWSNASPLTP